MYSNQRTIYIISRYANKTNADSYVKTTVIAQSIICRTIYVIIQVETVIKV